MERHTLTNVNVGGHHRDRKGTPIHLQTLLPPPEQIEKCRSRLKKKHITIPPLKASFEEVKDGGGALH